MKKVLLILLSMALSVSLYAQPDDSHVGFFRKVDSFFENMHARNKMDTMFVSVPKEVWAVRVASEVSQSWIGGRGIVDDAPLAMHLRSKFRYKERVTVGYRNVALGVAVDPVKLFGHKGGISVGLNSFGNRFGFKSEYQYEGTYHGNVTYGDATSKLKDISAVHSAADVDFYFVLNRKFSMNSVFGLSYIQKRSAGSAILTSTASYDRTHIKRVESMHTPSISSEGYHFGFGVGYGYNYVMNGGYLLHASILPSVMFYNNSSLTIEAESREHKTHITDFSATANISVIKNVGPWFGGILATVREMGIGKAHIARVDYVKPFLRVSVGKRF